MWRSDGIGWRARIGLLTPHNDIVPESEFWAMAPEGVSIHVARVPFGITAGTAHLGTDAVRAFAAPPAVDEAAALLAAAPIHVMVYGFTSSSYVLGADADAALKGRLEQRTDGIPVVIPCVAAVLGLRSLGVRTLALVDPPWFSVETNAMGATYFRRQGIEVVHHTPAGFPVRAVPEGQRDVHPGQLYEWVRAKVPPSAEAVFVGGNGFRAVGVIAALEADLQRPVLTANQVAFWHALHLAKTKVPVVGYGRLFEQTCQSEENRGGEPMPAPHALR